MAATTIPNIYVIGAQCTGKTTLVNALQRHFYGEPDFEHNAPYIISEVARTELRKHGFTTDDIRSSPDQSFAFQKLILTAQVAAERSALREKSWFVSDRSGVDPIIYAMRYVGLDSARSLRESAEWSELKGRMTKSLVVVCEAGKWLVDDGVRLMPEHKQDWIQFHAMFCTFLDEVGLRYQLVPCAMEDLSSRVSFEHQEQHRTSLRF
jgi:nicotinamide riboside kinase